MGMRIDGPNGHTNEDFRAHRDAAATTGTDGAWVPIAWDAVRTGSTGAELSSGDALLTEAFPACIMGRVSFAPSGAVGLTMLRARLVRVPVGGGGDEVLDEGAIGASATGEYAVQVQEMPALEDGDTLRVDVRSDGAANVALEAGETRTWLRVRHV
jgi:hypothetical protein